MSGSSLVTSPSDLSGTSRVNNCGYATNFGAGLGGEGPKGIEGVIVGVIFKPLVTRMVACLKELRNPENMVRRFHHSFNEVAYYLLITCLSLLDCRLSIAMFDS